MNNRRYLSSVVSSSTPVLDFPVKSSTTSPFDKLTVEIILAQHRAGTLPEGCCTYWRAWGREHERRRKG